MPLNVNVKGIRCAHPLSPTLSRAREREQNQVVLYTFLLELMLVGAAHCARTKIAADTLGVTRGHGWRWILLRS